MLKNHRKTPIAIAIRATNERTLHVLSSQLRAQMQDGDVFHIFGEQEPFADKMQRVFQWCQRQNLPISLVIDADILLRKNVLQIIRNKFQVLSPASAGFGIMLFDRFFQRPKFRGLHVYRTQWLPHYITHLPEVKHSLRPETELKKLVAKLGHPHENDFVKFYVGGLHDYFQWYSDIYFKMMIRSHRSPDLIAIDYIPHDGTEEAAIAQRGIADGNQKKNLQLDKTTVTAPFAFTEQQPLHSPIDVDAAVLNALKQHYGWSLFYWAGRYLWLDSAFRWYLEMRKKTH